MKHLFRTLLLGCALAFLPVSAHALVSYYFSDPVGDHTGAVDITGMNFLIDEASGAYTIDLTADAANPFAGDFRININLFNVTRDEYFQDSFNDYIGLMPSTTTLTLTGTNTNLMDWLATDVLATSTYDGLGNPPGTSFFRSSVADLPFQPICVSEDIIGYNGCGGSSVPEPSIIALLSLGLIGIGAIKYRRLR